MNRLVASQRLCARPSSSAVRVTASTSRKYAYPSPHHSQSRPFLVPCIALSLFPSSNLASRSPGLSGRQRRRSRRRGIGKIGMKKVKTKDANVLVDLQDRPLQSLRPQVHDPRNRECRRAAAYLPGCLSTSFSQSMIDKNMRRESTDMKKDIR